MSFSAFLFPAWQECCLSHSGAMSPLPWSPSAPPQDQDQDPRDVKYLSAIKTVTNSVTGDSVAILSHVTQPWAAVNTFNLLPLYRRLP